MAVPDASSPEPEAFIARWHASGGAEKANSQLFLAELCDLLAVPRPEPAVDDPSANAYTFERSVTFNYPDGTTSQGWVDLYRRGCFVLESKQSVAQRGQQPAGGKPKLGSAGMDIVMQRAYNQAQNYIRALPSAEGRPPFLITCDVGHRFDLYSEFSLSGGNYEPFPDPSHCRIAIEQLADPSVRELLRRIWLEPLGLDPSAHSARVTREVSQRLAELARALEADHLAEGVAEFLMRCLFCMFAEDAGLLPGGAFSGLVSDSREAPEFFPRRVEELWRAMKTGQYSFVLNRQIAHFNGPLFEHPTALPLSAEQLEQLLEAGRADWREVDPSIFGTLLERALDPRERHKLGAHYTPRAYVERLVLPTLVEPLRGEWQAVRAAAAHSDQRDEAVKLLRDFHHRLCQVTILDPACGTGNFLYVSLEHLKRLEGEVLRELADLGYTQAGLDEAEGTVGPRQFFGLEINPRAAHIAELVLWIGYLQWHLKTHAGRRPPEPILAHGGQIAHRDAVLDYDATRTRLDADGRPVTRWDGQTKVLSPVTGEPVPDESARVLVLDYLNPRPATWPAAEFVVGNPPFIGNWRMRQTLGDGYAEAIRAAYPEVPESCDYVMYWWHLAAGLARRGDVRRFGLITTNSLRQTFSRRVMAQHLGAQPPLSLAYAIPDHPWVDEADGADVRIAMSVGRAGEADGRLQTVTAEQPGEQGARKVELTDRVGRINVDLTVGVDVSVARPLRANEYLASRGVALHGAGFIVTPEQAEALGLGRIVGLEEHIRPYRHGRDLAGVSRGLMVIDLYGLTADEVRERFPEVYQWVLERVKPERDQNNRASYRDKWWLFGEPRGEFRPTLAGLPRYLATPETAKHRFFVFLDERIRPDNKLVNIALDDGFYLGVLSSRIHVEWFIANQALLENRPVYVKTRCFDPFPFPAATPAQVARIRDLGERLDAHRKARQALHPNLTLTACYNVLDRLRAGAELTAAERAVHEQGLVGLLRELHDELDDAVAEAYGWPADLPDEELLARLVALNAERAAEEAAGRVRWLRPEFQNPGGAAGAEQGSLAGTETADAAAPAARLDWPDKLAEQLAAVRAALAALGRPAGADEVAARFARRQIASFRAVVAEQLATLAELGHLTPLADGRYAG